MHETECFFLRNVNSIRDSWNIIAINNVCLFLFSIALELSFTSLYFMWVYKKKGSAK